MSRGCVFSSNTAAAPSRFSSLKYDPSVHTMQVLGVIGSGSISTMSSSFCCSVYLGCTVNVVVVSAKAIGSISREENAFIMA